MIAAKRRAFNAAFTEARYHAFKDELVRRCGVPIEFMLSETPVLLSARCDRGSDKRGTRHGVRPAGGSGRTSGRSSTSFLNASRSRTARPSRRSWQVDFGLVARGDRIEGRLVEMQAFPSLYGFQLMLAETSRDVWA
jgi:hypothetical protein